MQAISRADLYFKEGSSDKVYHATVEPKDDKFVVNFSYGRRGSTLVAGTKTNQPVTLAEATKAFERLVNSKLVKGYRRMESGDETIPQAEPADTPTEIQCVLLNPVDEDEAMILINDKQWTAQPKFDGVRFMLGRKNGKVYALNRKGKQSSVPNRIQEDAPEPDFLLDGELVGENFYAFDILELDGNCLRKMPLEERSKILEEIVPDSENIKFVPLATGKQKKELHESLKEQNAEGIVFKKLKSPYNTGRPASGGNYLKFKFYSTASCRVSKVNQKRSVSLVMECGTQVGNVTIPANHEIPSKDDVVEVRYLYAYKGGSLYQPTYLGKRSDVDPDHAHTLKFKNEEEE
jgi:bifunctional non-homologous end joining protein LigD